MTTRPRSVSIALVALSSLVASACVEEPRDRGQHEPARRNEAPQQAPAAIGRDGDVPQVHLPPRLFPPHAASESIPLGRTAALTQTSDGGALLLWATPITVSGRAATQLALRTVDPQGVPGPIWDVRRTAGTVRGIDIAMRGDQAMMVWNAEVGGVASQIFAERVRPDGTLVGSPFGIGTYRVADPAVTDASVNAARLGLPARVVPSAMGFAVSVRGILVRCGTSMCPSIRVAEVDPYDVINGRGGLQGDDPSGNIVLVGSQTVPWTLAVTFGGGNGPAHVETFGPGALSRIGLSAGELAAAWVHDGVGHAIVRRGDAFQIVEGPGAGDVLASAAIVQRTAFECVDGVPAVRLVGENTSALVRADDAGGTDVMTWAMNTPPTAASPRNARGPRAPMAANVPAMSGEPVSDVTAIRAGLLVARATRLELARCNGNNLDAAGALPWEAPTTDATAH